MGSIPKMASTSQSADANPLKPNGRAECLSKAASLVSKDRNKDYGDPEDNFREIATIQAVIARCKDPVLKVALDAIAVKLARLVNSPKHLDSWVDIAGYAACGYDIASREKEKSATKQIFEKYLERGEGEKDHDGY